MRTAFFAIAGLLLTNFCFAQYVYQIRADSVRIYNVCDTAELIIENRTRGVNGFLYNKGNGRTEFRRLRLESIGGSQIAISGQDTLDISTLPGMAGIDTIYRSGDNILYKKKGILHTVYAPLPSFKAIPQGVSYAIGEYPASRISGFNAYSSPDMPAVSDQALTNQGSGTNYYAGHVIWNGSAGYQMAVNWDGELTGPKGVFVRNKDDTKTTWGAWRELVFKDYADGKYALRNHSHDTSYYTISKLRTSGQAEVHWDNIINKPVSSAAIRNTAVSTTLTASDHILTIGSISESIIVTLPNAIGIDGKEYVIKNTAISVGTITIQGVSGQTIDGGATYWIPAENRTGITLLAAYGVWHVISRYF